MKHEYATFIFRCGFLVNARANSRAVNPYIASLSKKVTGFPSYLATTAFQRDCCYVQSLCNSLCARTEVILLEWNSWPMTIKTTHTYNWNWAQYSFALVASWATLFQAWYIPFHWIDSSGRKAQRTHKHDLIPDIYRADTVLHCISTQNKKQRCIFLFTWDYEIVLRIALLDGVTYKL